MIMKVNEFLILNQFNKNVKKEPVLNTLEDMIKHSIESNKVEGGIKVSYELFIKDKKTF
jgi:hypothetical protein